MGEAGQMEHARQEAAHQATATADKARAASGEVAGTAARQAGAVTDEARRQAGTAVRELGGRVKEEAQVQSQHTAEAIGRWADDLARMADNAPGDSPARSLAQRAAQSGYRASHYLEEQGADGVVEELQHFARKRPGVFLFGAALAGLAVGRVIKSSGSAGNSDGQGAAQGQEAARWEQDAARDEWRRLPDGSGV